MRARTIIFVLLIAGMSLVSAFGDRAVAGARFQTRCGWFSNPTPANISLFDRDGEWIVGVQGGHQVETDWDWPPFNASNWVETNGHYGFGCACLEMQADPSSRYVLAIRKAIAKPLQACKRDPSLGKWKNLLQ